jgi:hypothetical protein
MYRAGLVNSASQAAKAAIIDLRPSSNLEVHHNVHTYIMRERLRKANGHTDNHVVWTSELPLAPWSTAAPSFNLLDSWLTRIEADTSEGTLEDKLRRNKPVEAVDACWVAGIKVTDMSLCNTIFPSYANARIAAGGPLSSDVVKCQLKPLQRGDYAVSFTDDQWARMQRAFPDGVCNFALPGVDHQPSIPWLSFAQGPGGLPLGEPPKSVSLKK